MPICNPRLAVILLLTVPIPVLAQSSQAPSVSIPRLISVSGTIRPVDGQPTAAVETVTLAIYGEETGGTPLWQETQLVAVDAEGRYTLLLGATQPDGVPLDVFVSDQAQWLGTTFVRPGEVEGARMRITSVPYALHAADAVTLGGRPASDYVLTPTRNGVATTSAASTAGSLDTIVNPLSLQAGTPNALAKYITAEDVGTSAVSEVNGRVGINTGAPADYLHIRFTDPFGAFTGLAVQNLSNNANAASGMLFYDHNGAVSQFQGFNNTNHAYVINNVAKNGANQFDGSISFLLGGTPKFLVATNGNVGLGTVSPAHHLTVIGGPTWTSNGWTGAMALGNGSALGWYANGAGNRFGIGQTGGGLYFFRTVSDPGTTGGAAPTYDMVINDAGNVGVGTTVPTSKLEIAAQDGLKISGFQPFLTLNDTNSGSRSILAGGNGEFGFYPGTFIGGVPALLIKNGTGNVGIGVSNPTAKLQAAGPSVGVSGAGSIGVSGEGYQGVYGSGHFGVFGTTQSAPGNEGYAIYGEDPTGFGYAGFFGGNAKVLGSLVVDGTITVNTLTAISSTALCLGSAHTITTCSSSLRYKTNVTPFHSGLNLIDRLRPITFDWKASGEADFGLAAEEVAQVEPLLVFYNDTGEVEGVKYDRINVLLINAIKEQQAQIEQQREAIATLMRLQEDLVALKTLICAEHPAAVCQ
jgi:Chaperone of endosialidase